ncbi:MAG: Gldg family protein [Myxococcota bacterium]|nr:Gldg family protein [Myxococcota bacterium]
MTGMMTTFRKELRSYFTSPVALIFLGVFLVITLFVFFTYGRFFARNIADVRPLFEWLPILLIFLVSAITMRAWSEEQKMGTLEVLMTLPVKTAALVLGKLLAGMVLVGLALALTLPLPITVSFLGDVDWGPVIGGYVGALLLAGTYLAVGMCVSSRTDNQVVSLMVTVVCCGLLFMIGSDALVSFFGSKAGEVLRAIGSGSRFESIERGVLDIRDMFYYASLIGFFFVLNVYFLERKRKDTVTPLGRKRWASRSLTVALAGLNAIGGNLWLAPVTAARADLTEEGQYSLSHATERILGSLSEPLAIAGYFSEKTHPLLSPLVPRIRDFLAEYEVLGQGRVAVTFEDPNKDEALEEEVAELYDIKPLPFRVSARHEESVVNSYFHILIRYGDQYEVLSFSDLIEIHADESGVDVKLRNLEYDITRSIKKVSQGFKNITALFAGMSAPAHLTLYVTPGTLPEEFKEVPALIRKVAEALAGDAGGNLVFKEVDLTGKEAEQEEIHDKYGFKPMAVDLFGDNWFYLHLLLASGETLERIYIQGDPTEASIRTAIEAGLKRSAPGFLKTVGLLTEQPQQRPPNPNIPPQFQPPQPRPEYRLLEEALSEELTVKRIEAKDGVIPADIDVLIVARPGALTEKQQFAIDQYLMQGGAVIALAGAHKITAERGALTPAETGAGLRDLLAAYGVTVKDGFLLDKQNARFPVPIRESRGMFVMERIAMIDYPFFPDLRQDSFAKGHLALSGLQNVVVNWASPIEVSETLDGRSAEVLLKSSSAAWQYQGTEILPTSIEDAETAFQPEGAVKAYPVAAVVTGTFPSYFADRPSPLFGADQDGSGSGSGAGTGATGEAEKAVDRTGRTIKASAPEARLAVVGSSEFVSDLAARLGDQMGGGVYRNNFQLARNLVDWAVADTDLLEIRGSGAFARTLKPMEANDRTLWEAMNYIFVLAALGAVIAVAAVRRRKARVRITAKEAS